MANKYTAKSYITETHKQCSNCKAIKEHSEFHKDKRNIYSRGLAYYCKVCACSKGREYTARNAHLTSYKQKKKNAYIQNRFGITLDEYTEKLKAQNNFCAICKVELPASGYFTHLDHCHKTGKIRAFLCTNCNRGLGHFQDNKDFLLEAARYLDTHNSSDNLSKEVPSQ
jgi:hypothetical protein